jgi:hypothetical protein
MSFIRIIPNCPHCGAQLEPMKLLTESQPECAVWFVVCKNLQCVEGPTLLSGLKAEKEIKIER